MGYGNASYMQKDCPWALTRVITCRLTEGDYLRLQKAGVKNLSVLVRIFLSAVANNDQNKIRELNQFTSKEIESELAAALRRNSAALT